MPAATFGPAASGNPLKPDGGRLPPDEPSLPRLGGGAYLFGEEMKRVVLPVQLLLFIAAIGLAAGGIIFFRHHEKELLRRAGRSIPGPLLGPAARARDVLDMRREANVGGFDDDRGYRGVVVVAEGVGDNIVDRLADVTRVDEDA